jgi:hypothetical protein
MTTLIHENYEFWKYRENNQGQTLWRCIKHQVFKCKATLKTAEGEIVGQLHPEHNHSGNVATALGRKAVGQMKSHMTENIATPSASQGAVIANLDEHVQMALPKRATLSRVLRRHRQIKTMASNTGHVLPPIPTDVNFEIPPRFTDFLIHDSGEGSERMLLFGDPELLRCLERAHLWLADGTFKVVPTLFFQLYTIHFDSIGGLTPTAIYCLLSNKNRATYDRLLAVVKSLVPNAAPQRILLDFESAAMNAFTAAYPEAEIAGCYFHLCQSILRKVHTVGLKGDYDDNHEIRGFIRCLTALSHVPVDDVIPTFEQLIDTMPADERVNEVATYFEHTYVRGRRRPGRGENYGAAIFPVPLWNQFEAAGEGIARTTNSVEGWHHSLQSLFMCQHPTLWTFLTGIERDCRMNKASYLQAATGVMHTGRKTYRDLKTRVARAVAGYQSIDRLTYLRAIAHLSHA